MGTSHRTGIIILITLFMISLNHIRPVSRVSAETILFWHAFKGNTAHTGYIDQETDRKMALQWRYFFRGDYANPLQVVQDKIYFLDRSGFVCCVNRKDGSEEFRVKVDEKRMILGMDISSDIIVVSTGPVISRRGIEEISCIVFTYSIHSGELLWSKKIDVLLITPPVIENEKIWIASGKLDPTFTKTAGGDLICLSANDGEEISMTSVEDYAFYGNYLTMSEDILLAQGLKYDNNSRTQMPPRLFAFSMATGRQLWEQDPLDESRMFGTPSIKGNYIYLTENPGFFGSRRRPEAWLMKLELQTGKLVQSMNIPQETFGNFSPTLANDAIYINSFTGKIYAIDYEMDRIYWVKEFDRFSYFTELTASKNYLYTCLYNGEVIAVSKADGNVAFRYRIGNYGGIPVIADDQLLVTGDVLYCFSANADPILYTEPTSLDFGTLHLGEVKQLSFRILYTGLDQMTGNISCPDAWLKIRPSTISANIQTCFVSLDSQFALSGKNSTMIQIETNKGTKRIPVEVEIIPPTPLPLQVNIDESGLLVNKRSFMLLGETESLARVYINELMVFANENGKFSHVMTLKEGDNPIHIQAIDRKNRSAVLDRMIVLDTISPDLIIDSIQKTEEPFVYIVTGRTEPGSSMEILDETYPVETDGVFSIQFSVEETTKQIKIEAVDQAGNRTGRTIDLMNDVLFEQVFSFFQIRNPFSENFPESFPVRMYFDMR